MSDEEVIKILSDSSMTCDSPITVLSSSLDLLVLPNSGAGPSGVRTKHFTLTPTERELSPMSSR